MADLTRGDNYTAIDGSFIENTPEEKRKAALFLCAGSTDLLDAALLLEMLGLDK